MTKQDLQKLINVSVKAAIKEMKPLIETTIRKEFHKILSEAESAPKTEAKPRKMMTEEVSSETSLMNLIDEDKESDPVRAGVNEKIFAGKKPFEDEKNPFANVLNQTAKEVTNREGIYSNPHKMAATGGSDQVKVNLASGQPVVENVQPTEDYVPSSKPPPSKEAMAAKMGYGDMEKIGGGEGIPGMEIKPKSTAKRIIAEDPIPASSEPLTEVELPTQNPDGQPINYSKVPMDLVQNMMKDYRGLMKKTEQKVNRPV